jgi:hypothetical protein
METTANALRHRMTGVNAFNWPWSDWEEEGGYLPGGSARGMCFHCPELNRARSLRPSWAANPNESLTLILARFGLGQSPAASLEYSDGEIWASEPGDSGCTLLEWFTVRRWPFTLMNESMICPLALVCKSFNVLKIRDMQPRNTKDVEVKNLSSKKTEGYSRVSVKIPNSNGVQLVSPLTSPSDRLPIFESNCYWNLFHFWRKFLSMVIYSLTHRI